MLSIVVPTYNESGNVDELVRQLRKELAEEPYEVIFVDDSRDQTPQILEELAGRDSHVRYVHREDGRGLADAACEGFRLARGDIVAVMDADLQHPPSTLHPMLEALGAPGIDLVIASRYVPGGTDGGLSPLRKAVSSVARSIGRLFLPVTLAGVTDPTSGFFMFRKEILGRAALQPLGWKILLEVLVRSGRLGVREVPLRFGRRHAGTSKMSVGEQWNYLRHLARLMSGSPADRRFLLFALVGGFGVLVNMAIYYGLSHLLHVRVEISGATSATAAMLVNFALNNRYTWSDAARAAVHVRLLKYCLFSVVGIGISTSVLGVMYYGAHADYLVANLIGIATATVWNFWSNNTWTWEPAAKPPGVERVS